MKYRLYCFAQSGNAYKAALMLNLCSADWEPVFVDFFNGETGTEAFREINDMGEVPVLEAGKLRLSQSGVILDYLADQFEQFDAGSVAEHREIMRWILFDNQKFTGSLAPLRYLRCFTDQEDGPVTAFLEGRLYKALEVLEARLADRPFVTGEQPTIADLSLCGYLYWPDEARIDLTRFTQTSLWLERIQALPGWVHPYALMPGHNA